jgi:hypothetical protein
VPDGREDEEPGQFAWLALDEHERETDVPDLTVEYASTQNVPRIARLHGA